MTTPEATTSNLKSRKTPLPLQGVRVLDLSRLVAGNVLTQMLGDFGADVVKVESPAGDTLRAWKVKGISTNWKVYGRGKRSLCLDFRHEGSRAILSRLAASADVLVESFRPGTLEEMGLAPDSLLQSNPRLIVVRISGWGQDGPYRRRPGFGTLVEGMSGFAAMNGFEDREPLLPPFYLADGVAGLQGVGAVMIALREVEVNGGRGQVIDLPLLDPLFSILGPQAANYQLTGEPKPRTGNRSTNSAPRNAYVTKDGRWVCLSASTQGMTERLFRAIGRPELIDDPRFRTNADRLTNNEALDAIIAAFVAERTQAENVAFFDAAEVTIGPIYDISQIVEDPHVQARGLLEPFPDEEMGTLPMHAIAVRLSSTPGRIDQPAPGLGEHSRAVLVELGFSEADIEALVESGCVVDAAGGSEVITAGEEGSSA
jgi:crotonobetainyl-CoA:carnitine CoA-transferase CaiB-like acyl-CoA transferase